MQPAKLDELRARYQRLLQRLYRRVSALQNQVKTKDEIICQLKQFIKDNGLAYPQYQRISPDVDTETVFYEHCDAENCFSGEAYRVGEDNYAEMKEAVSELKHAIQQELADNLNVGATYPSAELLEEEVGYMVDQEQSYYSTRECVVSDNFELIAAEILSFATLESLCAKYGEGAVKLVAMGLPEAFWLCTVDGVLVNAISEDTESDYTKLCGFLDKIKQNVCFFDIYSQSADLARSCEFQFISFENLRHLILTKNGEVDDEQADEVAIPVDLQRDIEYVSKCLDAGLISTVLLRRSEGREVLVEGLREAGFRVNTAEPDIIQILSRTSK